MERAGMSELEIYDRTRDIFYYLKLPFDAPPPQLRASKKTSADRSFRKDDRK
jgi:hypothetical protein